MVGFVMLLTSSRRSRNDRVADAGPAEIGISPRSSQAWTTRRYGLRRGGVRRASADSTDATAATTDQDQTTRVERNRAGDTASRAGRGFVHHPSDVTTQPAEERTVRHPSRCPTT